MASKATSFDTLEKRPSETTSADRPAHIIDYQLMINNIAVFDLEDTGSRFDEQDPLVTIKIGEAKAETERQEDSGTHANFPESFVFDLTEEDVAGEVRSTLMIVCSFVRGLYGCVLCAVWSGAVVTTMCNRSAFNHFEYCHCLCIYVCMCRSLWKY